MRVVQAVSLVVGLALFIYLVHSVGVGEIVASVRLVGFGFVLLIFLSALRHLTRAAAWLWCIEADHRQIKLFELFNVRMAGEAVRFLSFTGPILGETSKAVLIRKRLPMVHGMSSVITENLTYSLGVIILIISGLVLLTANFAVKNSLKILIVLLCAGMLATVFAARYIISRRLMVLTNTTHRLWRTTGARWFKTKILSVQRMEEKIHDFYKRRKRAFFLVLFLEIVAQFINVLEVYLILYFIGVNPTLLAAYLVETAMKIINSVFFFVPGQVGVLEGGNALVLRALKMGVTAGITLSLIEKIRTLFWVAYGLAVWAVVFRKGERAFGHKDLNHGEMSPRETMQ